MVFILGLCGKVGSGKSTIAKKLIPQKEYNYINIKDPLGYICSIIGEKDRQLIDNILKTHVDPSWESKIDLDNKMPSLESQNNTHYSFSFPLKIICSLLTGIPFVYFSGEGDYFRKERETKIIDTNLMYCKKMTLRRFLTYIGTDVFRNEYNADVWVNIFENICSRYNNIIIDDVRFKNEYDTIKKLKGNVVYIERLTKENFKLDINSKEYESYFDIDLFKSEIPTLINDDIDLVVCKLKVYLDL